MRGRRQFDGYLMVDWSAASRPTGGANSIWLAHYTDRLVRIENPRTREEAYRVVLEIALESVGRSRRLLAGFDFSFGFPAGTATALGVEGWRGLWSTLHGEVRDEASNENNRFLVAGDWNRRMTGEAGPFWGCPVSKAGPCLTTTRPSRFALPAKRMCELRAGARSTWQLFYKGSVGSQSLVGIPRLEQLRREKALAGAVGVWPLETGFQEVRGPVTLAEIYPSMQAIFPAPGEAKDSAQVRTLARHFAEEDAAGSLAAQFGRPLGLSRAELAVAEREEGWILGIR